MHPLGVAVSGRPARERHVAERQAEQDQGAVLVLVLVLMVVGAMLVLPLMSYSIAVLRSNEVLSDKSQDLEGVKSGLRIALADPVSLYKTCSDGGGPNIDKGMAAVTVNGNVVTTKCNAIDFEFAQAADEIRMGLTATQVGSPIPVGLSGDRFSPVDPMSVTEWTTATSTYSETGKIWYPNLPEHGLDFRQTVGTPMKAGWPTCTVYFPGTYKTAVTLNGPTFFTNGIYYFESDVIIEGGASVVVGDGARQGCTNSQQSLFYAENVPSTHNISGLGGTWVLGKQGRIVVSNANDQPISLIFNRRYVPTGAAASDPSADVSIMTVNGELDIDGITGIDLDVAGTIFVPASWVGTATPALATTKGYVPSEFTPKPSVPDVPTAVVAQRFTGAAVVSWVAPFDGGTEILDYTVSASTGPTCQTTGATVCAFTGLSTSTSVNFTVVATNATGSSVASAPSPSITPNGGGALAVPGKPNAPTLTPYDEAVRIQWTAPSTGPAPITSYTVTASDASTCTVTTTGATPPPLQCDIVGLTNALPYTFTVVATNAAGVSPVSNLSLPAIPLPTLGDPPAPPVTASVPFAPTAVIDVDLPSTAAVVVDISGYVSIPQGRIHVDNPNAHAVDITGGVIAAQYDVIDGRDTGPDTVKIGFVSAVVQRKFRITSTLAGVATSVAIVQVNQNGAYAINSWVVQ